MIDLREIKERRDEIAANIKNRGMKVDIDQIIELQEERAQLLKRVDELRSKRNENAAKMKGKLDSDVRAQLIEEGKALKDEISQDETLLKEVEERYLSLAKTIPNYAHKGIPTGVGEDDNREIKRFGKPTTFTFTPKDHIELGEALDLVDFDTGTKVTGPKFYFLKNEAVYMSLALERYALDTLRKHGFTPVLTPDLAKEEILEGIGFNPRGEESNIYSIADTDLCLVGTAEITLGGYHANTILEKEALPIKFGGISHCFRREAGSAGQFSRGLYRVHQFSKVEMFVYTLPEESEKVHEQLLAIEEEIYQGLNLPYRVVDTCSGDLGAPAFRKYDIEAWMPGRGDYGEVTSTSNCTDYQARRLNIRYREEDGSIRHPHLLNGTTIAVSRTILAIMENYQREDGSIAMPSILVPYLGFSEIRG
ncbi:MAG: serine--tRNA ligase [Sphaerochaetaceae bacterium]|jgi:seryl-tRNA synthetase|nr:serine--tRNA ligase [Spirochaetales bacterium]